MAAPLLNAGLVKSFSTKYSRQNGQLQLQLAFRYDTNTILYKNFDRYETYKHHHDTLVKAIHEDGQIVDDFQRI